MIALYNPKVTKPRNRRFPLSVLSIGAMLEGKEDYAVVDGNLDPAPTETIMGLIRERGAHLLAVTVMPGPQVVSAVATCREIRARFPGVSIVWGGYFPSLYSDAALNAPYVDYAVRGQGEETFIELVEAMRGDRDTATIAGLSYKDRDGAHHHNPERPFKSPDDFPWLPYHRIPAEKYLARTFLGNRTAVHQASIGCPYACNFCGVISAYGSREKLESPARTEAILRHLASTYGADSVQFFDNNFFLREDHARELADRIESLRLRWWCEARIDILLRYSDATLEAIRRAGCAMIFFGAESGSDWALREMNKHLTTAQTLELAARIRRFGIVPEFSFVVGNPRDPERDTRECLAFVRRIKSLNPQSEIILNHYTPVPQRAEMYGGVERKITFPSTPDEWATERWVNFVTHKDPATPWQRSRAKRLLDDFEMVVASRWPTRQDIRLPAWGRHVLQALSAWRYRLGIYAFPVELRWAQRMIDLRKPKEESL
ncbi:MAG: radical SAM protein [Terriglobia bacterium]